MAAKMYVEFPVDPLIEIVLPKKKHDGGGGGGVPYLCAGGGELSWYPIAPTTAPIWAGRNFGTNAGGPDAVFVTFEASAALNATEVEDIGGYITQRPSYTYSGVTLLLGASTDGASYAVVASSGGQDVSENETFNASVSYQLPAWTGVGPGPVFVAFAVTGELTAAYWPWWYIVGPHFFGTVTTVCSVFCLPPPDAVAIG